LNQYEVAVLYDPGLEIDLEKGSGKVTKIFKDNGGKVVASDNWGKRKLAYPIAKQDHAIYVFYTVEIPAENIGKVEAAFNITDEVIRFLITKPDLKAIAKAEAAKLKKKTEEDAVEAERQASKEEKE
jgi:small subunit ribosomal protein S6